MAIDRTYIYGLKDPATDEIRYIGKADNPKARYKQHIGCAANDPNRYKKNWINGLKSIGAKPALVILEECNRAEWEEREQAWIKHGFERGWKLTNLTEGGRETAPVTDVPYAFREALALYATDAEIEIINRLEYDALRSIAHEAAVAMVPHMRGYWSGRVTGESGWAAAEAVIHQRLGELASG